MMDSTAAPELPKASSLAVAWSMESRRWNPLTRLVPMVPTTAVPAAAAVNFVNFAAAPAMPSSRLVTDFFARSASGVKSLGNLIFSDWRDAFSAALPRSSVARFALSVAEVSAFDLMVMFSTWSADVFTSSRPVLTRSSVEETPSSLTVIFA